MSNKQFAALIGFLFVAVAFGVNLLAALLALVVAALVWGGAAVAVGELDPEDLRERVEGARSGFQQPARKNPPR